jgi:hypothetical protein
MANAHITAAFRCKRFKGTTRLVLLYLADAASPLSAKQAKEQNKLPFGYCKRKVTTIMAAVNCNRQPTISACLSELKCAGAIKQWRKKHLSAMYFVDLDWLKANVRNDKHESIRKAFTLDDEDAIGELELPEINENRLLSNENRMVLDTESVTESNENRLHSYPPLSHPFAYAQGDFVPPAVAGRFNPPASRDKPTQQRISLRSEEQNQQQDQEQQQEQQQEQPRAESCFIEQSESTPPPVHPPAPQAIAVPPGAPPAPAAPAQRCPKCKQQILRTEEELKRHRCSNCWGRRQDENASIDWRNPVTTHDWSKDKDTCARCGAQREAVKYEEIFCDEPERPTATGPEQAVRALDTASGLT